jgi:Lrp/AsnC family transcriptional regulator, leucine-responsive regulatory protein
LPQIDKIDAQLLQLLQEHGRTSQHDLAQAVGLSAPAVGERLRKLEERRIIRQYTVVLDPRRLERDVTAFVFVGIGGSRYFEAFLERATTCAEVLECHSVTGQGSHLLKIRTQNTSTLEQLLADIQSWPGVQWTTTSIVLSTMKETARLDLAVFGAPGPPPGGG